MKTELKTVADAVVEIVSNPKAGVFIVGVVNVNTWWLDWGSPIIDAVTSILGVVLVAVLIRYHWQNTKKIMKETQKED